MDPARRAAGKKPDAAAPRNARIVPRLFTSALGGGLSAWAHAIGGDSEARLQGLLLGTRQIPVAVASTKSRHPKSDLRVSRRTTTPGSNLEGINTTVAAGGGGAVEQGTRRVDQPAGADRRFSEAAVPWLRCHAQAGFQFSRDSAWGQGDPLHRWMEEARKTGIHSLVRFVRTLKQDLSAVEAAVSEPWSNGPVEGQLNRLKMLKRQMYGRAGIELLRARLLPEPAFSGP